VRIAPVLAAAGVAAEGAPAGNGRPRCGEEPVPG